MPQNPPNKRTLHRSLYSGPLTFSSFCTFEIQRMYLGYLAESVSLDDTGWDEPSPGPERCGNQEHGFFADSGKNGEK